MPAERAMTDPDTGRKMNFCRMALGKDGCRDEVIQADEDGYCHHLVGFRMSEDPTDPNYKLMEPWQKLERANAKGVIFDTGYKRTGPGRREDGGKVHPILDSDVICNPPVHYIHEGIKKVKGTFFNARVYRAGVKAEQPVVEVAPPKPAEPNPLELVLAEMKKVNERIDGIEKKIAKPKRKPQRKAEAALA